MSELKLIRGARILQQLERLDEATYAELERNTMNFVPATEKRQWVVNPIQVTKMELTPARETQNLIVKSEVNSNGNRYAPTMIFDGVIYEDGDQNDNVSFTASDQEEYHIIPIDLKKANCKVSCNCLDFYWRFSNQNYSAGSLDGNPPPAYQKKTQRGPVNPQNVPGVCKHLLKLAIQLKDSGIVR
ncbi:MAG: hypothetical protein KAS32_08880 [Candidatus Peribacteraceae bacterium]|nr:hypothetical protein [Candidatus Peribacteraceae bacterium]